MLSQDTFQLLWGQILMSLQFNMTTLYTSFGSNNLGAIRPSQLLRYGPEADDL